MTQATFTAAQRRQRKYYARNKARVLARQRAYNTAYQADPRNKAKRRERDSSPVNKARAQARWLARAADPATKRRAFELHLQRRYGLSLAAYNTMYAEQGAKCKLCRAPLADRRYHTHVDHVPGSKPAIVRGILCRYCNVALGQLEKRGTLETFTRNIPEYVTNLGRNPCG